jgi:hypothetical protein
MISPADPKFPGPAIALSAYRAIHSQLVDYLEVTHPETRAYVIKQMRGRRTFDEMWLAICAKRIRVDVFLDPDDSGVVALEVSVIAGDGQPFLLLVVEPASIGVLDEALIWEQRIRLDQEVAAITGGTP